MTQPGTSTFVINMLGELYDAGMTRNRLARHLGVNHSTVSRWTEDRRPNGYLTFRLARLHRHLTGLVIR